MPTKKNRDQTAVKGSNSLVRDPSADEMEALRSVLAVVDDEVLRNAARALSDVVNAAVDQIRRSVDEVMQSEETRKLITEIFELAVANAAIRASESRPRQKEHRREPLALRASTNSEAFIEGLGDLVELFPDTTDPLLGLHEAAERPRLRGRSKRRRPRTAIEGRQQRHRRRGTERNLG